LSTEIVFKHFKETEGHISTNVLRTHYTTEVHGDLRRKILAAFYI